MYKTYYVHTWNSYNLSGLITKAENRLDAFIKLKHYLERHYKDDLKEIALTKSMLIELNKTEIITFIS